MNFYIQRYIKGKAKLSIFEISIDNPDEFIKEIKHYNKNFDFGIIACSQSNKSALALIERNPNNEK